jgi:tetrahydromethanopterin S-methyltransferase subunit E
MFGLFKKDPRKKLQTQYEKLLYDAMILQRSGDIMGYSTVTEQANVVLDQIVQLDAEEKA